MSLPDKDFDRRVNRTARMLVVSYLVTVSVGLISAGVVVWAIIKTVNHFFG